MVPKPLRTTINDDEESAPLLATSHDDYESMGGYQKIDDELGVLEKSTSSIKSYASIMTLKERESNDRRSSLGLTVSNMLLCLQGSAVFGVPFAVAIGGYPVLIAALVLAAMTDFSGQIVIACMYDISPKSQQHKRIYGSMSEIAEGCWGRKGRVFIDTVNSIYLTLNNVVNVVLTGKSFYIVLGKLLPHLSMTQMMAFFSPVLLPLLFIRRMSFLAYTSTFGVAAVLLATVTAVVVFVKEYSQWSDHVHVFFRVHLADFPLAVGIFMYSLVVNPIIPQIEGTMKNPDQMGTAMHIALSVSTVLKLAFGILGVLTFGVHTQQLVSVNISMISFASNIIIAVALIIYGATNFALMFNTLLEQMDMLLFRMARDGCPYHLWSVFTRVVCVAACTVVAVFVPYFGYVAGLVGAVIGTCFIFIFPIVFHLQLKWKELHWPMKTFEVVYMCVGVFMGCMAVYSSSYALIEAIVNRE